VFTLRIARRLGGCALRHAIRQDRFDRSFGGNAKRLNVAGQDAEAPVRENSGFNSRGGPAEEQPWALSSITSRGAVPRGVVFEGLPRLPAHGLAKIHSRQVALEAEEFGLNRAYDSSHSVPDGGREVSATGLASQVVSVGPGPAAVITTAHDSGHARNAC